MRGRTIGVIAAGFAAVGLVAAAAAAAPPKGLIPAGTVSVLFAPTGKDRRIAHAISDELRKARSEVRLAIYQFTSRDLVAALSSLPPSVRVRAIFDGEQATAIGDASVDGNLRKRQGIEVRYMKLPGSGAMSPKFHHKFAVIDGDAVITGSFNWTVLADEENHENVLIVRDGSVAAAYAETFDRLWGQASPDRSR